MNGRTYSLSPHQLRILLFLRDNSPAHFSKIMKSLQLHPQQLSRALKGLLNLGLITKTIRYEKFCPTCKPFPVSYYSLKKWVVKWVIGKI